MESEFLTTRAYSTMDDPKENTTKESTRFPNKNFADVINSEMEKSLPDILIVQSGSVDITILKTTKANVEQYGEYFKQQTVISASNLFTSVTNALISNPDLHKAIIMKHIPRYDFRADDPLSVKAALSQLYNDTLVQLYLGSPHKHRLMIGIHNLDCAGGVLAARYRNKNMYNGTHMIGQSGGKSYTESVLCIIKDAELIKNSPPSYFHRYHDLSDEQTKASTQGRCSTTQKIDWKNDRDIRKNNSGSWQKTEYLIPTSNHFPAFNSNLSC